ANGARRLEGKNFLTKLRSGTCASRRGIWRVAPFIPQQQEFFLEVVVWRVAPSKSCSSKGLLEVAHRAG
ncbi:hypothetical protein A2U01_0063538, partial [Trifolium medium]|nr:hypothetical protein [Trifolium medium]